MMKARWLLALLAVVVACICVFFTAWLLLGYVMRSMPSWVETAILGSLVVTAVGLVAALVLSWRGNGGWIYRVALAVMLIVSIGSFVTDATLTEIAVANRKAQELAERETRAAKFQSQFETYKKDVAERIAAKKPFAPREAQAFLDFVQDSDLSSRSYLPDRSPEAFALLQQALDGKIFDPNMRAKGPRTADVTEDPLFVGYYKFYIQSGATMAVKRVREREWKLFQMLIAGGADLGDPSAAVLRDVVTLQPAPYEVKGWIALK